MYLDYNMCMSVRKILYYKGIKTNSFGIPLFLLKNSSRIKNKDRKRSFYNYTFPDIFKKDAPKNLIVMYDIPYSLKKERDWFRRQLIKFGYIMIQKSVWVGPSPLPQDFLSYLKDIKIESCFKTFKLANSYKEKP